MNGAGARAARHGLTALTLGAAIGELVAALVALVPAGW